MNILRITAPCVMIGLLAPAAGGGARQIGGVDAAAPLTSAQAALLGQNVTRPVIAIMKHRLTGSAAENDQAPMMSELAQVHASHIKHYRIVNAFAATVSDGEL